MDGTVGGVACSGSVKLRRSAKGSEQEQIVSSLHSSNHTLSSSATLAPLGNSQLAPLDSMQQLKIDQSDEHEKRRDGFDRMGGGGGGQVPQEWSDHPCGRGFGFAFWSDGGEM